MTTIKGWESVEKEFDDVVNELKKAQKNIMAPLSVYLMNELRQSIEKNVYNNGDKPKEYPRRSENPQFGTPLSDVDANTFVDIRENGVMLNYAPDGSHSGTRADLIGRLRDEDSDEPIKPNPVHGDDLVRRIETGKGYDWDYSRARPFFTPFVNEMIDGGMAEMEVVRLLNLQFGADSGISVVFTGEDTKRDGIDWEG